MRPEKSNTTREFNYYRVIVYRLFIALVLFWLSRLFFLLFNVQYFSDLSLQEVFRILFFGLRFDFAGLLMLNAPFLILMALPLPVRCHKMWRAFAGFLFFAGNILGLMVNFMDSVYFRFTQKRMTGDIFQFAGEDVDLIGLMPQFIHDYWPYQLTFLLFSILLVVFSLRVKYRPVSRQPRRILNFSIQAIGFLISAAVIIIGVRGGFQLKPINIISAGKVTEARNTALVLNTPFTIIKTLNQKTLVRKNYFPDAECQAIFNPEMNMSKTDSVSGSFNPKNVIILIIESLSSEHIGAFNQNREGYLGFTPFLDSLIEHATVFRGFANGKQSIEGIPSILASLPGLMDRPYINSAYAGNKINSLASLLKMMNYTTAFYHGGTNGTMDFDGFADISGFDDYYGRTEYNNEKDFDGNWGIFDEPFYKYLAENLTRTKQPFFATFFSLSSHHPYTIPDKYYGKFREGRLEIQQAVMYADYSLGTFFKESSKLPWYNETLFVITADHTSEAYFDEYQTRVGMYEIPLIFYAPGMEIQNMHGKTASQVDILPTILELLNFEEPFISFGNRLFSKTENSFAVNYINGVYQILQDGFVLQFDGAQCLALFNYENDPLLKYNLKVTSPERVKNMEKLLKAYIQQYNKRMIENRLVVTNEDAGE
ncbi:MAG: sulfatase-like hydrolase/transferase [Bacteroidales bacterium]|nr:sulfatase-like hydrolase/transferase [Bacteroidales bacterium]